MQSWGATLVLDGVVLVMNRHAWRSGVSYTGREVVTHANRAGATTPAYALRLSSSSIWTHDVVATAFADPFIGGDINAYGPCNRTQLQAGNFVNPAANDYRPALAGLLVDACPRASAVFNYTDPRRVERCQNHSRPDQGGHCDVGAYELPTDIPADRIFANGFQ